MLKFRSWIVLGMMAYAIGMRLLPYMLRGFGMEISPVATTYPWNFSPMTAIFLFGGAMLADRRMAILLPLIVLGVSDLFIGLMMQDLEFVFYGNMPVVYACFILMPVMGYWLRAKPQGSGKSPASTALKIAGAGLLTETAFFLITNFGEWIIPGGTNYPATFAGLTTCYAAALPFFGRSLISTGIYTTALFGCKALLWHPEVESTAKTAEIPAANLVASER